MYRVALPIWLVLLATGCAESRHTVLDPPDPGGAGSRSEAQPVGKSGPDPLEKPPGAVTADEAVQPPPVADPPRAICDGSSAVRLYLKAFSGGEFLRPGTEFTFLTYVIITGECRFWVMQGTRDEARTGTLTREAADRLAGELHYSAWYRLSNEVQSGSRPFDGGGGWALTDGTRTFACGACIDAVTREVFARAERLPRELYALGEPVAGPMRVSAVDNSSFQRTPQKGEIGWPLSTPVDRFVYVPSTSGPNRGVLLEDPADLKTLRELRPRLHGSDHGYLPVRTELDAVDGGSDTSTYELYFRDVIPFEDPATGELRPF